MNYPFIFQSNTEYHDGTCIYIDRYKVSDYVDGNLFDISMTAKACFVDGGDCELDVPILTNALVPKSPRTWNDTYTTKGKEEDFTSCLLF